MSRKDSLPPDGSSRTMCAIFENMRKCYETRNFSYLPGLIEEAQYRAERMENAIELYSQEWGELPEAKRKRDRLRVEIGKLKRDRDALKQEGNES